MNKIAVLDLETDPFEHGKMIQPFVAGFYDGSTFTSFWSPDCVQRLVTMLESYEEPLTIYAHNGGRFDFFYFLHFIGSKLRIVNSRIIQAFLGHHELRDSFAIMPFALETYKKTPINYNKFKSEVREQHREEIVSYLRDDCVDLYDLCTAFYAEFGDSLTIGGASMKELKKFHTFRTGNELYDAKFRQHFYFGGRNQVFKAGTIMGPIKVFDVNSMYPSVMQTRLHPVSTGIYESHKIEPNTAFVSVEGFNRGAFPIRKPDGSLDFTCPSGIFHTTIHEFEAAEETGTFKTQRIIKTLGFSERHSFEDFVTHFYDARNTAKAKGDKIRTLFYKFVLNSAYGKFAQNPENYYDWFITQAGELPAPWHECVKSCADDCKLKWSPAFISENEFIIWQKPLQMNFWYNIATGASITGAARAELLRGLSHAENPYYCDTDSIICTDLRNVRLDDSALGAWKLECIGDMAAICGKKLYAVFDSSFIGPLPKGESIHCVKKAHKGAKLTGDDIIRIAHGDTVESENPVPSFKLDGSHSFTKRRIKKTAQ